MEDSGFDSDPKGVDRMEDERLFPGSDSSSSSNSMSNLTTGNTNDDGNPGIGLGIVPDTICDTATVNFVPANDNDNDNKGTNNDTRRNFQRNVTRQLQKKLAEARIEQAKRIRRNSEYMKLSSHANDNANCAGSGSGSAGIISIQRLSIPRKTKEHRPLVEYWQSDDVESEDETTLFPLSRNKDTESSRKQDLTDTFSVEELSEGSEDSLNLGPARSSQGPTRIYNPVCCLFRCFDSLDCFECPDACDCLDCFDCFECFDRCPGYRCRIL